MLRGGGSKLSGGFRHLSKVAGGAFYAEKIHRGERPFGKIADGKEPPYFWIVAGFQRDGDSPRRRNWSK